MFMYVHGCGLHGQVWLEDKRKFYIIIPRNKLWRQEWEKRRGISINKLQELKLHTHPTPVPKYICFVGIGCINIEFKVNDTMLNATVTESLCTYYWKGEMPL